MKKYDVKIMPLGGQDEMGKSMYAVDIDEKLFIIDAGFRFPDSDKLGVDTIIPSFDWLKDNQKRISAIIITHGHEDVMGALPYILREMPGLPVYAPSLTANIMEEQIARYERHRKVDCKLNLIRVARDESITIDGVPCEFFPLTHSIPGAVGVALWTRKGYVVYGSEFIIDFGAPEGFRSDLQRMIDIGKKGVLALMMESSYARRSGYTAPKHKLTDLIRNEFEQATGRIIITSYARNIFRTLEIIELTKKYNRQIVFLDSHKYDQTNLILKLDKESTHPVFHIEKKYIGKLENLGNARRDRNYVVLVSGKPDSIYSDISDILDGGNEYLKIREDDTFIIASPVLPGTEKIATAVTNNVYRTPASHIKILKNKSLSSMHASVEDIRVALQVFRPKYYIPIKGRYRDFIANAAVARDMGIKDKNIVILDNGEFAAFARGVLAKPEERSSMHIDVPDVMVDGIGIGDVGDKVIDDRVQLSNDGVVIVGVTIDKKTKKIVANTDCQTRGFVYVKEQKNIIRHVVELCEAEVSRLQDKPDTDMKDIRGAMVKQSKNYIRKETGKDPMVICVVVEV